MLDPTRNFAKAKLSTGYDEAATTIVLQSNGSRFPATVDGAYNAVWWNWTDYKDPSDDPNREIVRVTARTGNTLTITRAQEGTGASTKNTAGKEYYLILAPTQKMIDDIDGVLDDFDTSITDVQNDISTITTDVANLQTQVNDLTTSSVAEGSNLYFTNARARGAISLSTPATGTQATYNSGTGVLSIPVFPISIANTNSIISSAIGAGSSVSGSGNVMLGSNAGAGATAVADSVMLGTSAGIFATNATTSVMIGPLAGQNATNSKHAIFIGHAAGNGDTLNTTGGDLGAILIGHYINTGGFANSVLIGSGEPSTPIANTRANQFMLSNSITHLRMGSLDYVIPVDGSYSAGDVLTISSILSGAYELEFGAPAIPTLQQVTDSGAVTTNDIEVGGLLLTDTITPSTGYVSYSDGEFTFLGDTFSGIMVWSAKDGQLIMTPDSFSKSATIGTNNVSGDKTIQLPNADATLVVSINGATADANGEVTLSIGNTLYTADDTISGARTVTYNDSLTFYDASTTKTGLMFDVINSVSHLGAQIGSGPYLEVDGANSVFSFYDGSIRIFGGNAGDVLTNAGSDTATWAQPSLITGISGGQTVIGGTDSGDDLTLSSTSNATKGSIIMGTSIYDQVNDRFGVNIAPTARLHIRSNAIGTTQQDQYGMIVENSTAATSGQQQLSPAIVLKSHAWLSSTAVSHSLDYRIMANPSGGTTAARGGFLVQQSLNGATYTDTFEVGQTVTNGSVYNLRLGGTTVFALGGGTTQFYGSSSGIGFYNSAGTVLYQTIDQNGRTALTPAALTTATTINAWSLTQTWNNVSGIYTGLRVAITNNNSASTSRAMDILVGGASSLAVDNVGNTLIGDGKNIILDTTTGTKIGTGTTQKIGFWNATPIVQPTTSVAAASFVANTSGIANDTATWDGYTAGQVVKALRNVGILA